MGTINNTDYEGLSKEIQETTETKEETQNEKEE